MKEVIIGFALLVLVLVVAGLVVRHFIRWVNGDLPAPPKEEERPPRFSRHRPDIREL